MRVEEWQCMFRQKNPRQSPHCVSQGKLRLSSLTDLKIYIHLENTIFRVWRH